MRAVAAAATLTAAAVAARAAQSGVKGNLRQETSLVRRRAAPSAFTF